MGALLVIFLGVAVWGFVASYGDGDSDWEDDI